MWRPPVPPYQGFPPGYYHQAPPPPANNVDLASAAEQWAMMQAVNQQAQNEQQYAYPPQPQFQQQQHQFAPPSSYPQSVQQPPWPPHASQGLLPPPSMPQYQQHPPQDPYADPLERRTTGLLGHAPQPTEFDHHGPGVQPGPPHGFQAQPAYAPPVAPQAHQAPPGQFQAQFAPPGLPSGVHPHFQQPYEAPTALPPRPPLPVDPSLTSGNSFQPYAASDSSAYHDASAGYPYQYDYSNMAYHPGFDFESVAQSHNAEAIKKLPPWLREGLEKLEREKQKEREKQRFVQEYEAKIKEESTTLGEKSGKTSKFDSSPSRSRSNSPVVMKVESEEESEEEEETWSDEIRRLTLIQATKDIVTSVLMNATTRVLEKTCTAEIEARKTELNKSSISSGKTGGLAAFLNFTGSDSEEDGEDDQPPPPPKGAIKGASTAQKSIDTPAYGGIKLSVESSPSPSPEPEKKEVKSTRWEGSSERPLNVKRNESEQSNSKARGENGSTFGSQGGRVSNSTSQRRESKRSSSSSSSNSSSGRNKTSRRNRSPEPIPEKKRVSRWNRSPEEGRRKDEDRKESSRREEKRPQRERSRERSMDRRDERPSLKRSDSTRSGKSTVSSSSKTSRREERRRSDSRSDEDVSRRKRSQRYS
ncbi:hypothetical protein RvY_14089-2 [Ramazzottius varieornatus]|uniref:Uncharacterized protein n=1 Tax=Ramazzottius varieornatus TaxID=947166 RepID=A0A1D1VQ75_RAMVA|nr:hypothetical protein RvY_14089-2 [Ramazzottius varieornatus]